MKWSRINKFIEKLTYREATIQEDGHWLFAELADLIFSQYASSSDYDDSITESIDM